MSLGRQIKVALIRESEIMQQPPDFSSKINHARSRTVSDTVPF